MKLQNIFKIIGVILYLAFMTFIFVGAGFITNILFNLEYDTNRIELNSDTKVTIAQMTIILFWIVFIPLSLAPIGFGIKEEFF
jgi:hypothetical protein